MVMKGQTEDRSFFVCFVKMLATSLLYGLSSFENIQPFPSKFYLLLYVVWTFSSVDFFL
jgi:hypothetical protein